MNPAASDISQLDETDRDAVRGAVARLAHAERQLAWMSDRQWWEASHPTDWPIVVLDGLDRVTKLPDAARAQATEVIEAWTVAAMGVRELGNEALTEGIDRFDAVRHHTVSSLSKLVGDLTQIVVSGPPRLREGSSPAD